MGPGFVTPHSFPRAGFQLGTALRQFGLSRNIRIRKST
jgi:hypothetical protein